MLKIELHEEDFLRISGSSQLLTGRLDLWAVLAREKCCIPVQDPDMPDEPSGANGKANIGIGYPTYEMERISFLSLLRASGKLQYPFTANISGLQITCVMGGSQSNRFSILNASLARLSRMQA